MNEQTDGGNTIMSHKAIPPVSTTFPGQYYIQHFIPFHNDKLLTATMQPITDLAVKHKLYR